MTSGAADIRRRAAAHALVADVAVPALDEATAHHLFRVARVRDGDVVTITDGAGAWRICRAAGGALVADGEVTTEARPGELTVAVAIPKADRPEWIVQKLTELGVGRIVFLHAQRSVVRWNEARAAKHLERLRRVAAEALGQSRGVWLPTVEGPLPAAEILSECLVAHPGGRPITVGDAAVAIGPEGGWTDDEVEQAAGQVGLAGTVLRVETAALAAAVKLQSAFGHAAW